MQGIYPRYIPRYIKENRLKHEIMSVNHSIVYLVWSKCNVILQLKRIFFLFLRKTQLNQYSNQSDFSISLSPETQNA